MPTLTDPPASDNVKIQAFRALCWSRAERWRAGEWDWIGRAVDPLQRWAEANGLVDLIGQDEIQRLMAEAFTDIQDAQRQRGNQLAIDRFYDPTGRRHGLKTPPGGAR